MEDRSEDVLDEARRYLADLVTFEGTQFTAPEAIVEHSTEEAVVDTLEAFRSQICECTRCRLGATRQNFVFGSGNPAAGIMFIGEAPGAEEDRAGQPFVGKAGQLLTKIIEAMDLSRDEVYICNILKCRPPNNRDPLPDEIEQCEPYLKRQIESSSPASSAPWAALPRRPYSAAASPWAACATRITTTKASPWWPRTTRRPCCATPSGSARLGKT